MDLSIILPVVNEAENLRALIPRLSAVMARERLGFEILVIDGGSTDATRETAEGLGARVIPERRRGYAGALETGFDQARGDYLLTLDADLSHEPDFVAKLWRARSQADIVIASRYVRGGVAYTNFLRRFLSGALNLTMRRALSIPVRDLSSGYRLYRREVLSNLQFDGRNFEVLEEILVRAYARGFSVCEVPFTYFPRESGRSHARLLRFGWDLTRATFRLWRLRNSIHSADYDERAFYSIIPLQRYWQRQRHRIITFWARGARRVLDAGCGSSVIIQSLNNAIGMDPNLGKLRFLRQRGIPLLRGSAFALPFKSESFDCVISSQVIARMTPCSRNCGESSNPAVH
jgi:glycosyltransferase involved in cell wall biosynthesis